MRIMMYDDIMKIYDDDDDDMIWCLVWQHDMNNDMISHNEDKKTITPSLCIV